MKTRNYYIRHWAYIVIRRNFDPSALVTEIVPALTKFRGSVSYGLVGTAYRTNGKMDFILICARKEKPFRYDSIAKRFPSAYVTRLPVSETPSEVSRKWRFKHSDKEYFPAVVPFGGFKGSAKPTDLYDIDTLYNQMVADNDFVEYWENKFDKWWESVNK